MMLAAAWRTWAARPPPSDALQRAAGAWAGRVIAPAWRKLAARGAAARLLRRALAGWAQRELSTAWHQWLFAAAREVTARGSAVAAVLRWGRQSVSSAWNTWQIVHAAHHRSVVVAAVRRWQP